MIKKLESVKNSKSRERMWRDPSLLIQTYLSSDFVPNKYCFFPSSAYLEPQKFWIIWEKIIKNKYKLEKLFIIS